MTSTHPQLFHSNDAAASPQTVQFIPTRDLLAEVESMQWLCLDVADLGDDASRAYGEEQLTMMVEELERRRRLHSAHRGDPLRPAWPPTTEDAFRARVEAVKAAWPILDFCRDLLACELVPTGPGKWTARCPLPDHPDRTPSFGIDEKKNVAYCHGCHRGGDVLTLTGHMFGLERFTDKLKRLEREGGADDQRSSTAPPRLAGLPAGR